MRFCYRTVLKGDAMEHSSLSLGVKHHYSIPCLSSSSSISPDIRTSATRLKQQLPAGLDVYLATASNLQVSIAGTINGRAVDANVIEQSALVREMMRFLRHVRMQHFYSMKEPLIESV